MRMLSTEHVSFRNNISSYRLIWAPFLSILRIRITDSMQYVSNLHTRPQTHTQREKDPKESRRWLYVSLYLHQKPQKRWHIRHWYRRLSVLNHSLAGFASYCYLKIIRFRLFNGKLRLVTVQDKLNRFFRLFDEWLCAPNVLRRLTHIHNSGCTHGNGARTEHHGNRMCFVESLSKILFTRIYASFLAPGNSVAIQLNVNYFHGIIITASND